MSKQQLEAAESAMASAQVVKPDSKELSAIKLFCAEEIKHRERATEASTVIKGLRAAQKASRVALTEALQAFGAEGRAKCAMLTKADATRLESLAAAEGLPAVPPYVRLVQTNKDATITAEVVQEAIQAITEEDLRELAAADGGPAEAVRAAVLQNIRRAIRSFTVSLKLMTSVQRGLGPYDVPECTPEMADQMLALWSAEHKLKAALACKKQDPEVSANQTDLKTTIESFFIRTGLTSQRIVVEGRPFRLVRRVSVRKPKVGLGMFEKMLADAMGQVNATAFRPTDLIRALQIQLSSVPPETKSSVALCAVKAGEAE